MNQSIQIFCEGITDQVFIADCLENFYGIVVERVKKSKTKLNFFFPNGGKIVTVDGCSKLTEPFYLDQVKDNSAENGTNLIVFDADYPPNTVDHKQGTGNRGFQNATKKLINIKKNYQVDFDFYLWPNHQDDGTIENLLRQLIPKDKECLFDCLKQYKDCLACTDLETRATSIKNDLNLYLHTLYQESKERNRDYKNKAFWNLDVESIADLKQFKTFLDPFFIKNTYIP